MEPTTSTANATFRQYLASIAVTLGMVVVGESFGWPSPTLPKLQDPAAPIHLDHTQISWVVSLIYLGNIISPIPSGYVMDHFGRKHSLVCLSILPIFSWVLILFAQSALHLYIARFLAGLWVGVMTTISPIYIAEVAEPRIRGSLGNFVSLMTYLGNLIMYIIGPYVSYSVLAMTAGAVPLLFLMIFSNMPESPYYHLMHNDKYRAKESLSWLRGDKNKEELWTEINTMHENVINQIQSKCRVQDIFATHASRKAFLIVEVLAISLKFSGTGVIMAFASTTLPEDMFDSFNTNECVIILGLIWVTSAVFSVFIVDHLGRKILLIISSFGCGVTTLIAGLWFYLDTATSFHTHSTNWIPFASFILHGVLYSLGLGTIGIAIKGEVLAANIKAKASAITTIVLALASLVVNKFYLLIADLYGMYVNYWLYSCSCFLATAFIVGVVIETKGNTLQEIQDELGNRKVTKRKTPVDYSDNKL